MVWVDGVGLCGEREVRGADGTGYGFCMLFMWCKWVIVVGGLVWGGERGGTCAVRSSRVNSSVPGGGGGRKSKGTQRKEDTSIS